MAAAIAVAVHKEVPLYRVSESGHPRGDDLCAWKCSHATSIDYDRRLAQLDQNLGSHRGRNPPAVEPAVFHKAFWDWMPTDSKFGLVPLSRRLYPEVRCRFMRGRL